jgi:hypothetical protein
MIETPHHAQYYNLFREDAAGAVLWSQRLHHAVRAMHELLVYLDRLSLSDDEDQKEFASSVQADLFYDADFIEMLPKIAKGCVAQCRHFFRADTHFTPHFNKMLALPFGTALSASSATVGTASHPPRHCSHR